MGIDYQLLYNSLPSLLAGARVTIQIAFLSWLIGFILGTVLAFLQTARVPVLYWLISGYVALIRGTPMLIHITFLYYMMPLVGISLSNFWTAVIAIGINSSAYVSQIIRSGITAVGREQKEAGYVLGLSSFQIARFIVFPQALRIVLPALAGEMTTLIKDSSLASVIGVMELYKEARSIMNQTYDVVTLFFVIALLYLIMTSLVTLLVSIFERKAGLHVTDTKSQ